MKFLQKEKSQPADRGLYGCATSVNWKLESLVFSGFFWNIEHTGVREQYLVLNVRGLIAIRTMSIQHT